MRQPTARLTVRCHAVDCAAVGEADGIMAIAVDSTPNSAAEGTIDSAANDMANGIIGGVADDLAKARLTVHLVVRLTAQSAAQLAERSTVQLVA